MVMSSLAKLDSEWESGMEIKESGEANRNVYVTQRAKFRHKDFNALEEQEFFEDGQESLSTLVLRKTQESYELQDQLKQARINYFQRIKKCEDQEKDLEIRKQEFKAHVAKFERFMNDNEQKRNRATKRAVDEVKEAEQMEEEILCWKQEIELLQQQTRVCEAQLRDNKRYEKYLEMVVFANANDYFEGINDILTRYETLQRIMCDLKKQVEENELEIEELKHSLSNYIKEKQNEMLVLDSLVINHKQHLEKTKAEGANVEQSVYESELANKLKNSEIGEVKLAISNIYGRSKLKWWTNHKVLLTTKLDRIATQLITLQEISKDYEKMLKQENNPKKHTVKQR